MQWQTKIFLRLRKISPLSLYDKTFDHHPIFPQGDYHLWTKKHSGVEVRLHFIFCPHKLRQNISFVVIVALSMAHGIKLLSLPWITVANEEWPVDSQKSWPRQNVFSGLMCMGSILLFPVQYWKKKKNSWENSEFQFFQFMWLTENNEARICFDFFTKYLRDISSSALDPLV